MRMLAVDSATPVAGVALLQDGIILKEEFSNFKKTHSETLMPVVDRVLRECQCSLADLDALAVTVGPGSFTGLRIGLALVKGLALSAGLPVVGINTLEVIAHNLYYTDALVCPLLNARKGEVYCGFYRVDDRPRALAEMRACAPGEFIEQARSLMEEQGFSQTVLLGDGYLPYAETFQEGMGEQLMVAPSHLMLPRAAALVHLAADRANRREFADIINLCPVYIRLSEAEYRLGRGAL